jgi:fucose permease
VPKAGSGRIIVAAILAILVYGMISPMLGTLLPGFHLTPEQSGNVAFAQALGLMISSLFAGPLVDARGKKTALLLGLSLASLALFLLPASGGYQATMALMFLLGLGGGTSVTGANALVGDVNESRRASMLNLLNMFFGVGGLLTPLIMARLVEGNAVVLCYLVAGLTGLTLLVHAATSMPAPSGERGFRFSEIGVVLECPAR